VSPWPPEVCPSVLHSPLSMVTLTAVRGRDDEDCSVTASCWQGRGPQHQGWREGSSRGPQRGRQGDHCSRSFSSPPEASVVWRILRWQLVPSCVAKYDAWMARRNFRCSGILTLLWEWKHSQIPTIEVRKIFICREEKRKTAYWGMQGGPRNRWSPLYLRLSFKDPFIIWPWMPSI
jgi:hypothetical protein